MFKLRNNIKWFIVYLSINQMLNYNKHTLRPYLFRSATNRQNTFNHCAVLCLKVETSLCKARLVQNIVAILARCPS